jgi:hypothetical protein
MPFTNQIFPLGFVLSSDVLVNVSPVPVHGLVGRDEVTALEIMVKKSKKNSWGRTYSYKLFEDVIWIEIEERLIDR